MELLFYRNQINGSVRVAGVLQAFIAHSDNPTAQQAAKDVLEKLAI